MYLIKHPTEKPTFANSSQHSRNSASKPIPGDMIPPNPTKALNISPPVPMQLRSHSSPIEKLDTCLHHAFMRSLTGVLCKGSRGIAHDEDIVPLLDEGLGREGNADFC